MARKCQITYHSQNHTLQTILWHREEEIQNTHSHTTARTQIKKTKQLSIPQGDDFITRMNRKKCVTYAWTKHKTRTNQHKQQPHCLRMDSSQSNHREGGGGAFIITQAKGSLTLAMGRCLLFSVKNESLSIVPFFTLKPPCPGYFMAVISIFDIKCFKEVKFWVEQSVLH